MIVMMMTCVIMIFEIVSAPAITTVGVTMCWLEGITACCLLLLLLMTLLRLNETRLIYLEGLELSRGLEASKGSTWYPNLRRRSKTSKSSTNLIVFVSDVVEDELIPIHNRRLRLKMLVHTLLLLLLLLLQ
jgi:hypothetical protein